MPTYSESKILAVGRSVVRCFDTVALPTPKVPFTQTIMAATIAVQVNSASGLLC